MKIEEELKGLGLCLVSDNEKGYKILNKDKEVVSDFNFKNPNNNGGFYHLYKINKEEAENLGKLIYEWS